MKKTLLSLVSGFALFGASWHLSAAPLERPMVPADAKWLLHLDVEALQKSKLGAALIELVRARTAEGLKQGMNLDVSAIIAQTGSLTASGTDFKPGPGGNGLLMWRGSKEIEQIVAGLLIQQAAAAKAGEGNIRAVREGTDPVYSVNGDLFVAIRPGRAILVSQKLDQLEDACEVMDGKASSLADRETFTEYQALPGGFFLLALAENFAKDAGLPAQAQVLKLAEGGRVALGEEAEKLKLSVSLKTRAPEDAVQIQQVLQGLVALASLAHVEEPELAKAKEWVRGTQVVAKENLVSMDLAVPVEAALQQLELRSGGKPHEHGAQDAKENAAAPENEQKAAAPDAAARE